MQGGHTVSDKREALHIEAEASVSGQTLVMPFFLPLHNEIISKTKIDLLMHYFIRFLGIYRRLNVFKSFLNSTFCLTRLHIYYT